MAAMCLESASSRENSHAHAGAGWQSDPLSAGM